MQLRCDCAEKLKSVDEWFFGHRLNHDVNTLCTRPHSHYERNLLDLARMMAECDLLLAHVTTLH
jgi:hypothetical protein